MSALKKGDHLYLVDGSGYLFRAYHALPPLTRKSDGLPTGAVSGYCNMLWKLLEDMKGPEQPTHLAVIFDASEKTFRNKIYKEYKAHRPPPPEDLIPQFPLVRDATRAFGVSCVEMNGYEADDLIATYARLAREAGARCTIISSDKDLMQLVVDGKVELLDTMKNRRLASAEVLEKFGVTPDKVVQVQALAGDSTDNVPGVRGIGVKTAAELINIYGDIETLLGRVTEIKQNKRRETLIENAENARISLKLVTLDINVPLKERPDEFAPSPPRRPWQMCCRLSRNCPISKAKPRLRPRPCALQSIAMPMSPSPRRPSWTNGSPDRGKKASSASIPRPPRWIR